MLINRPNSRCTPIYFVLQVANREQSTSDVCVCPRVQSSPQLNKGPFQGGRAEMDYNKAGYQRYVERLFADTRVS